MLEIYLIVWFSGILPAFVLLALLRKNKFVVGFLGITDATVAFCVALIWPAAALYTVFLVFVGGINKFVSNGLKKLNLWWVK